MSAVPYTVEVGGGPDAGGVRFTVPRLKPKLSLAGLRLVGKVLLPAIGEAANAPEGQVGDAFSKVVEGLDCLPELLTLFASVSQYESETRKNLTALQPFVDDVFCGHPEWIVEFLAGCVQAEYGGFLKGSGPLGSLMSKLQARVPVAAAVGSISPST